MDLQPKTAIILRNNEEVVVPTDEVEVGDLLLVKPGAQIPVDGTVVRGQSSVNEAMITGESIPVSKTLKDKVIGGTINQTGTLTVQAKGVGQDTVLAQIIKMVEDAQTHKPPIQRRADAIAARFVPFIIILALITFAIWLFLLDWVWALGFSIAVLVAACPCALGLATPAALMVGIGRGAQLGILFKTGEGLEVIPQVDTIVFDKTGTLTVGHPTVTDIISAEGNSDHEAITLIASLERLSEHPLAEAIVQYAQNHEIQFKEVTDFQSFPGQGVTGQIENIRIQIGSETFMREFNIDLQELLPHLPHLQGQGKTTLFAAQNGKALVLIAIADTLKPDSTTAVRQLQEMGIHVTMLTGDRKVTAQAIAQTAGIDRVVAEVLPNEKAQEIQLLQSQGHRVAMAGDGVNDAPALAQADVGIALGSGTDVSVEAGDIVLVSDSLLDVVSAVQLGRKTMVKIKQGFFWALIYNMILLPIAAGILFPYIILRPEWAALAMALSSVSVVTNALLLNRYKPSPRTQPTPTHTKPIPPKPRFAIDPICKMKVDTTTGLHSEHNGKRYFFCSTHCQTKFEANPHQYEVQDLIDE
jgi:Cu+-exporting ATPase